MIHTLRMKSILVKVLSQGNNEETRQDTPIIRHKKKEKQIYETAIALIANIANDAMAIIAPKKVYIEKSKKYS